MTYAVLSAVTAVIWALIALDRAGFDIGSLNPFLWKRRKEWLAKRAARPIFALSEPIEVACVLLVAVARESGELLTEDRERLVGIFMRDLKLDERHAREQLKVSEHMLRDGPSIVGEVKKIVMPCRERFNKAQIDSLTSLFQAATGSTRPLSPRPKDIATEFQAVFSKDTRPKWGES